MLREGDVIDSICDELRRRGYSIEQRLETTQQGYDIIAIRRDPANQTLIVEAKGETSSRVGSQRYGQPFDSAQVRTHVAEALYQVAKVLTHPPFSGDVRVGIGMPDSRLHRKHVGSIHAVLKELDIAVFWVKDQGPIQIQSNWTI